MAPDEDYFDGLLSDGVAPPPPTWQLWARAAGLLAVGTLLAGLALVAVLTVLFG